MRMTWTRGAVVVAVAALAALAAGVIAGVVPLEAALMAARVLLLGG